MKEPTLAHRKNPVLERLRWPKYASPKLDGIRAIRPFGDPRLHTRKLKLVPNINVRELFTHGALNCCDGELIVGEPTAADVYHKTESVVMSYAPPKPADGVQLFLFDTFASADWEYERRLEAVKGTVFVLQTKGIPVVIVPQTLVRSPKEFLELEDYYIEQGYEGGMLRDPRAPYKHGRSTLREEYLLKWKRFEDGEAVITDVYEQMENQNEAFTSELGRTKRSKKQEGMVGKNTLGGFTCRDDKKGWTFDCGNGPGLTQELRKELWSQHRKLVGKTIKYRWQPAGTKDKPRSPRFLGFRTRRDR